jgi:hypothetical protein
MRSSDGPAAAGSGPGGAGSGPGGAGSGPGGTDGGPPGAGSGSYAVTGPTLRLRYLVLVLAIMVVLTAGWPLLNLTVSDHRQLSPRTTLTVGPGSGYSAAFTVGPGWSMEPALSNPRLDYSLTRGVVDLDVSYVAMSAASQATGLWAGMRDLVRLRHPGVSLGQPRPITTAQGRQGMTAGLSGSGLSGTATVFALPARKYAVELIVLGPQQAIAINLAATRLILHSVRFPTATR